MAENYRNILFHLHIHRPTNCTYIKKKYFSFYNFPATLFPDTDYGQESCRKPEDMYLFHMVQFYDTLSIHKANNKTHMDLL
jgi:hypothetical protein